MVTASDKMKNVLRQLGLPEDQIEFYQDLVNSAADRMEELDKATNKDFRDRDIGHRKKIPEIGLKTYPLSARAKAQKARFKEDAKFTAQFPPGMEFLTQVLPAYLREELPFQQNKITTPSTSKVKSKDAEINQSFYEGDSNTEDAFKNIIRAFASGPDPDSFLMDLIRNTGELPGRIAETFPLRSPGPTYEINRPDSIELGEGYKEIAELLKGLELSSKNIIPEVNAEPVQGRALKIPEVDIGDFISDLLGKGALRIKELENMPEFERSIEPEDLDQKAMENIQQYLSLFGDINPSEVTPLAEIDQLPMEENLLTALDFGAGVSDIPEGSLDQMSDLGQDVYPLDMQREEVIDTNVSDFAAAQGKVGYPAPMDAGIEGNFLPAQDFPDIIEMDRLVQKSLLGRAGQQDLLDYIAASASAGMVPNFTDQRDGSGFVVDNDFYGSPARRSNRPDISGLKAQEQLSTLQDYQGSLLKEKQKITEEAAKQGDNTKFVLDDIAATINEMQSSSDPLIQRLGQQRLQGLQLELQQAESEDKRLEEEYKQKNIGTIDQELAGIEAEIQAANTRRLTEADSRAAKGELPDNLKDMIRLDMGLKPSDDVNAVFKEMGQQLQTQYFVKLEQLMGTPYTDLIIPDITAQKKADRYYQGIMFKDDPILQNEVDILNGYKEKAIREIEINPGKELKDAMARVTRPEDIQELRVPVIRNKFRELIDVYADDKFISNLDWMNLNGRPESKAIVDRVKAMVADPASDVKTWQKVMAAIPQIANEVAGGVNINHTIGEMLNKFAEEFQEKYGRLGVQWDANKYHNAFINNKGESFIERFQSPRQLMGL